MPVLKITQGDATTWTLSYFSSPGVPMDLTGASIVTQVPAPDGEVVEIPNGQVTILDQTNPLTKGQAQVQVLSANSSGFLVAGDDQPLLEVVSTVTQGASVVTFRGYILRVYPPVPVLRAPGGGN